MEVILMLKALVITPNERTVDFGCLLAVARAEACRREQTSWNPTVRALVFVAELGVYVAVYEVLAGENSVIGKTGNQKVDGEKLWKEAR
jgi:hypothetical protein